MLSEVSGPLSATTTVLPPIAPPSLAFSGTGIMVRQSFVFPGNRSYPIGIPSPSSSSPIRAMGFGRCPSGHPRCLRPPGSSQSHPKQWSVTSQWEPERSRSRPEATSAPVRATRASALARR